MPGKRLLWRLYPRIACLLVVSLAILGWLFRSLDSMPAKLVLGGSAALALAGLISWAVSLEVARSLARLRDAAERYAEGELGYKLHAPESVEFAELTEAFNAMARRLEDRIGALLRRNNEQEAVLTSMVEGVLAVDTEERVISLNLAAGRLLGANPKEMQGRKLQEVVRNAELSRFVASALVCKRPVEGDVVLRNARERVVQAHGAALRDPAGRGIGAVIVLNDVSRLRQLENMRRDFAANVSHELKTPITSIKGFVETLLDGAVHDPGDAERFLRIIARQADRLNAIIEDLLSLSRIEKEAEAADIDLNVVGLREALNAAIHNCETKAAERGIRIVLGGDPDLEAKINPPLFEQAVTNLLDNAVKHSNQDGQVELIATQRDNEVLVQVRDQGCGIAEEHLSRLFERFYRVDKARSRKLGGTGLGLAIVKHIVLAHRGQVTVESREEIGSTFTIHLPAP
jgi:two-component system, OmpR family, phosphate regulon sensor histidine kinase PhoR